MRKFLVKLIMLSILFASTMKANEFRSPWLSERGPLRYKFEEGDANRYNLDLYSLVNTRESHKAFMKHGTDTHPLTALFFNKADIPLNEIFPCSRVHPKSENYSPYMDIKTIKPRVSYYETGANFGARLECPVYKNKGRIGLRVNVPFRQVEIEREDISDENEEPWKDSVLEADTYVGNYEGITIYGDEKSGPNAKIYRLDLISKLFANEKRDPALVFGNGSVTLMGPNIAKDFESANQSFFTTIQPSAGVIFNQNCKDVPNQPNFHKWGYREGDTDLNIGSDIAGVGGDGGYGARDGDSTSGINSVTERHAWTFDAEDGVELSQDRLRAHAIRENWNSPAAISKDNQLVQAPNVYFFTNAGENNDYSKFMCTVDGTDYPLNMPCYLKNGWLVLGRSEGTLEGDAENISKNLDEALEIYKENPEQWLMNHGDFELDTQRRTGLGDIDLDLFYEHMFNKSWIGEVMIGVRFPTGSDDDYYGNPYRVHLGNGEHWEIKLGGMLAWNALEWLNVKLDAYVSHALEAKEHRMAAFKGAKIKNFGPKVDADVDWTYFVARLDFEFFHMKTKDISGIIGYEFYYKTEDDVKFRCCKVTPWYGNHIDGVTSLAATTDNKLAEANTEAIAHKIRGESRIQINPWFEIVLGGSFTFAGQNIPRETDCHGGFIYRF